MPSSSDSGIVSDGGLTSYSDNEAASGSCSTDDQLPQERFEEESPEWSSCGDDKAVLLGSCDVGTTQEVAEGKYARVKAFLRDLVDRTRSWPARVLLCMLLLEIAMLILFWSFPEERIGGPLGERYPIGDNMGYKGPSWREDKQCTVPKTANDTSASGCFRGLVPPVIPFPSLWCTYSKQWALP